jgi:hypothetical protein
LENTVNCVLLHCTALIYKFGLGLCIQATSLQAVTQGTSQKSEADENTVIRSTFHSKKLSKNLADNHIKVKNDVFLELDC